MKKNHFLLCLGFFFLLQLPAWATDYYISNAGNDTNAGTRPQPWRTVAKVNRQVLKPGDKILFAGGEVFAGNVVISEKSQTRPGQPITIGSFGPGRATIRVSAGNGVLVRNLGDIVVQDLVVQSRNLATNQGFGVKIYNDKPGNNKLDYVRIRNVEASNFRWAGIYVGGIPTDLPNFKAPAGSRFGFRDVRIDSCVAHHNMYYGIYLSAAWSAESKDYGNENVRITDCVAYENAGDSTYTANHSGSGIMLDDTDGGLIEFGVSYRNGALNAGLTGGPCAIWTHASNRVVIQHCEAYENRTNGAADGGGFDLDGGVTNSIVQYCYSHDNDGAGYLVWNYENAPHELRNNIIRYNISANDGRKHRYGGIHIGTSGRPVTNMDIYQNTIYMPLAPDGPPRGIWTGGSQPNENLRFYNNLIVTSGPVPFVEAEPDQKGLVFLNNAYWRLGEAFYVKYAGKEYRSLAEWQSQTGQEQRNGQPTGLFADPKVVNLQAPETLNNARRLADLRAYRLLAGSPLRKAGLNLSLINLKPGKQDLGGTTLSNVEKPDIGAFQFR